MRPTDKDEEAETKRHRTRSKKYMLISTRKKVAQSAKREKKLGEEVKEAERKTGNDAVKTNASRRTENYKGEMEEKMKVKKIRGKGNDREV